MSQKTIVPYGSWKSPITSNLIVKGTVPVVNTQLHGGRIYFIEARPAEQGRNTILTLDENGSIHELTPSPYNVRTRVHEYGGAPYVVHEGEIIFSNFSDNLLYRRTKDGQIEAITRDSNLRYADGEVDARRHRLYFVREDHTKSSIHAETTIVTMRVDGSDERIVAQGNDFYSNPRLSPDGRHLAWLTWNHPNMPWDETELWVADVADDGHIVNAAQVAGGRGESVSQPRWSPDGQLYFVSDRTNWWNIYCLREGHVQPLHALDAEFSAPSWQFGFSNYDFVNDSTIICTYTQNGTWYLAQIDTQTGTLSNIDTDYTYFSSIHATADEAVFIAASPTSFPGVVRMNPDGTDQQVVRASGELEIDPAYLSIPESIEFPTDDSKTAHAIYYRPYNPDYQAPHDELPPLLVHVHGGPTSASSPVLNLTTQYWTSRGFAVIDVNYGGSTGYGREYRDRLKGNWGVVDVQDAANAVRYLVERGLVDERRVAIAGGSAGGYTTLASLVFTDVYAAGASHFGLSELEIFAKETHKFESRYMDGLLGPYPEAKDVYYNRSPINFTDGLSCPVIFFQGLDDKIVPPNQAELMVEALRKKGLPVAYVAFEGEGHGFRIGANIKRSLDGEFYFYSKVFGFQPADDIEPVHIDNL
ncbi:S9 family peptidase [Alicyclobacillus fastidiosus]|uniref:S9 family peptidase n=1 Tax=Alicyclobacillus fastidiosus TaxID=392011 RepID=A0ABV5AC30_9BACL|nr:S9 family peptidase [Alicyclobacillus fastidiosus]WEH10298.1 S9 family peptidase [Alicyclobacillus fastidiosus]